MQIITASYVHHHGRQRILLRCPNNPDINEAIKKLPGRQYSKTYGAWHLPCNKNLYLLFKNNLPSGWQVQEEKDNPPVKPVLPVNEKKEPSVKGTGMPVKNNAQKKIAPLPKFPLNASNQQALEMLRQQLVLLSYSSSTQRTYMNEFQALLNILGKVKVMDLSMEDLKRYMLYCAETLKLSENSLHSRLNAVKFYFEKVLHRENFFWEIPRPKKPELLPTVFSPDEVASILNSVRNKKHKAMLMLTYGTGMRVSEVVNIKTQAFDSNRMTIFVSRAKGKRDRVVGLSPVLLVVLRDYAGQYKPGANGFFFQGNKTDEAYSTRSLQEVLQSAKKKAGVIKPGGVHALRHSFATHLVDRGTDVTMIQKLLGHKNIKTTMIYLHTSNKDLLKIVSPLDDLKLL